MNNKRIEDLLMSSDYSENTLTVIDDKGEWSLDVLRERVYKLSSFMKKRGIGHLDSVAIVCENSSSFIVAIISVLLAGAVAVPLDPQLPYDLAKNLIKRSKAKLVLISGTRPEYMVEKNYSTNDNVGFDLLIEGQGEWSSSCSFKPIEKIKCKNSTDRDPAFIMFTSGTTGLPKGVVLSHRAIMKNIDAIIAYMNPDNNDIFNITKTMVHSSTLTGEILVALKVGARIIAYNPVVPPSTLLKRIQLIKPSIMCVNPTILRLMIKSTHVNYDLSSVKLLYTSGAVVDQETLIEAEQFFTSAKVLNVYGLTEAGPRLTAQRADDIHKKYGSVGKTIKGVNLKVLDSKGTECKCIETGTVFVKTESIMSGYWDDMEATNGKIVDGWLKTGDLGYLDEDGDLFILGRADEMIIRGSHNIDPYRIEGIIKKLSGIVNCVVVGVPDKINGERIICLFQRDSSVKIEQHNILNFCREYLAPYEIPQGIYEVKAIPTTPGGKISRYLAGEYYKTQIRADIYPRQEVTN